METTVPPRSLTHEVTAAFSLVIAGAVALLTSIAAATAWLVTVSTPTIDRAAQTVEVAQGLQQSLLQEQSSLRGFTVTGDPVGVSGFRAAQAEIQQGIRTLTAPGSPKSVRRAATQFQTAETAWERAWADGAIDPQTRVQLRGQRGDLNPQSLAAFVRSGDASFAVARTKQEAVVAAASRYQKQARQDALRVVAVTAAVLLLVAAAVVVSTIRRRRSLRERVVGPVGQLLEKVRSVGRGEFGASPILDAPAELLELRDELVDMSGSLRLQQQALSSRAEEAAQTARRLQHVVEFAREVSSSLTVESVLDAVTSSACQLLSSPRARVWLLSDDGKSLRLEHDSLDADPPTVGMTHAVGASGVGRAARERRLCYSLGLTGEPFAETAGVLALSFPLIKGQRTVVGVLEVALTHNARQLRADTVDVLEAMGGHAATAIDAALLYQRVETLSLSDPLTSLANRRRFDQDIDLEVQRSKRAGRDLTILMVDVDHFKRVNDEFGHSAGDRVLREVGELLAAQMRTTDTAYRFGGEEFAVLARDTDTTGALVVAERLRRTVQDRFASEPSGPVVTVSVGLASMPDHARDAEALLAAADAALYRAKEAGRNRVMTSGAPVPQQRSATDLPVTRAALG